MIKILPSDTQQGAPCYPISFHFSQREGDRDREREEEDSHLTPAGSYLFSYMSDREGH